MEEILGAVLAIAILVIIVLLIVKYKQNRKAKTYLWIEKSWQPYDKVKKEDKRVW